jgi:hypothetical protein
MNVNRFFWDSHWLEIWSNHSCPSMGPNEGAWLAMDSGTCSMHTFSQCSKLFIFTFSQCSNLFIKVDFYILVDMIQCGKHA